MHEMVAADFARELERELNELKAIHKTAILECTQYTPESWAAVCEHAEPCSVWLDGAQMTRLMKASEDRDYYESSLRKAENRELNLLKEKAELRRDKERLDWLFEYVICSYVKTGHPKDVEYLANRDAIEEAMNERYTKN